MIRRVEDSRLDFKYLTTQQIFNQIRAVAYVYPTAYNSYQGEKIKIYESSLLPKKAQIYSATPGQIVKVMEDSIWVKTVDGLIELKKMYDENDKRINLVNYFKVGYHLK